MLTLPARLPTELRELGREIDLAVELARDVHTRQAKAVSVSHWSVQDHLEHLLRADTRIVEWVHEITAARGAARSGRPTTAGRLVLVLGFIPRGKGTAPGPTTPTSAEIGTIVDGLCQVRELARQLEGRIGELRSAQATRPHPILGHFTVYQWVRFARVHHKHHRRIIADIVARST